MSGPVVSRMLDGWCAPYAFTKRMHRIDLAVLYVWPDGMSVMRPMASAGPPGFRLYLVEPSGREAVSSLNFIANTTTPESYCFASPDAKNIPAYLPRWVGFALDMLWGVEEVPQGPWGYTPMPFFLEDAVFDRAEEAAGEAERLHQRWATEVEGRALPLGSERNARGQINREVQHLVAQIFDGYLKHGDWITAGHTPEQMIRFTFNGKNWVVYDQRHVIIAFGPTPAEALRRGRVKGIPTFLPMSQRDAWFEKAPVGEPTVDFDLEPYDLLNTVSPIAWPVRTFAPWWRAQRPASMG